MTARIPSRIGLGVGATLFILASAAAAGACRSSGDETTAPPVTEGPSPRPSVSRSEAGEARAPLDLPDGYRLVGIEPGVAPAPSAELIETLVAVGASGDPRFVEISRFRAADGTAAQSLLDLVDGAVDAEPIELDGGGRFAFVDPAGPTGVSTRSDLGLTIHGPDLTGTVSAALEDDVVALGGAGWLQPADIGPVVRALEPGGGGIESGLPDGMTVIIDEPLGPGAVVEIESVLGPTRAEIHRNADRAWFDYLTRGHDGPPPDGLAESAGPGEEIRILPSSDYDLQGAAQDPVRVTRWSPDRGLMIVTHPPSVPDDALVSIIAFVDRLDVSTATEDTEDTTPGSEPAPEGSTERPAAVGSLAPTEERMGELQDHVEAMRETDLGHPISFEFVDEFPTDDIEFSFISPELWTAAVALSLTEDGQTLAGANRARIDRIRGTPGVVALQPTQTETDVVVVHEMVHIIDPPVFAQSDEPLSPAQAVSEGNAHRVAHAYLLTLEGAEQEIMLPFPHIFEPSGDDRLSPAVQDLLEFPYDEGRLFMTAVAGRGGEDLIDEVFRRPPVSTEQVLFVDAWLDDARPVSVDRPEPPAGVDPTGEGVLGAYLLALAARAGGADDHLELVQAWAGDRYVAWKRGSDFCLAASVVLDSGPDATALGRVLRPLAETLSVVGDTIDATFCS